MTDLKPESYLRHMPALFAALFLPILGCSIKADDWPQWIGPERDGVWREQGIVEMFDSNGPPVKWRVPVNPGYVGPAATGRTLWEQTHDCPYAIDYPAETLELFNGEGGFFASAFIVQQAGRYWIWNDHGELILGKLTPARFELICRAKYIMAANWSAWISRARVRGQAEPGCVNSTQDA